MNATKYYVSTTRLVVQGDPDTPSTWQDLYRMLPTLRNSLSCTVCESLLVEPYTPEETSCEHHVCKSCKGGVKALKPTCSWCKDYSKYSENVQLRILIQNYKKLCGLIKINRMWGHILRQGDLGQHIRDIISESEGERKGVRRCEDVHDELKGSSNLDVKEEVVEEEIVGECELVPVDLDISRDDPPDEIISSPISKLSMYRNEPDSRELENVKVNLENNLDAEKANSSVTNAELTGTADGTCRSTPSPTSSTPSPPNVQKYLSSTTLHNASAIKTCTTAQTVKGGIRKIKGEAFILNPLKTKSDFPQFRKLDSTPKAVHRTGSTDESAHSKLVIQNNSILEESIDSSTLDGGDVYSLKDAEVDIKQVRATSVIVKQELHGNKRLSIDSTDGESFGEEYHRVKVKRKSGCRCGNATLCPGKLTCCGQRCPCYVDNQACLDCKCKGCRNPHRPGGGKVRPALPLMQNMQISFPNHRTKNQDQKSYTNKFVLQQSSGLPEKVVYTARSPEKVLKTFNEKVVYPVNSLTEKVIYTTNKSTTDSTSIKMPVNVGKSFSLKDLDLSQVPILNLNPSTQTSQLSTVSVPLTNMSSSTIKINHIQGLTTTCSQLRVHSRNTPTISSDTKIQPLSVISVLGSMQSNSKVESNSFQMLNEGSMSLLPNDNLDIDVDYA